MHFLFNSCAFANSLIDIEPHLNLFFPLMLKENFIHDMKMQKCKNAKVTIYDASKINILLKFSVNNSLSVKTVNLFNVS